MTLKHLLTVSYGHEVEDFGCLSPVTLYLFPYRRLNYRSDLSGRDI